MTSVGKHTADEKSTNPACFNKTFLKLLYILELDN